MSFAAAVEAVVAVDIGEEPAGLAAGTNSCCIATAFLIGGGLAPAQPSARGRTRRGVITSPLQGTELYLDQAVDVAPAGAMAALPGRVEAAAVHATSATGFPARTGSVTTGAAAGGGGAGLAFRESEKAAVLEPSCCKRPAASETRPGGRANSAHTPEVP